MKARSGSVASLLIIGLLAALAGCTMYGGRDRKGWAGATGGEDLERQFWADIHAKNFVELERHMAVSWVLITPSGGVLDRNATLQTYKNEPAAEYLLSEFKVIPNGHDMVVTYLATSAAGTSASSRLRMMTVWQKAEKGWVAIVHTEVPQT